MDEYIKNIYNMIYSPIITPYNLLENAELDNYKYVKYYKNKNNDGLITEMKCDVANEGEKIYYYYFDSNYHLQKIYEEYNDSTSLIFDRTIEIETAKNTYCNSKESYKKAM